jgi:hypothetical protein
MIGYYLGAEVCNGVDWIPVAQRGEKRGIAVNLGYLCTCYSFKKGLLRGVAKNLNPSVLDPNSTHPLIAMNIRCK